MLWPADLHELALALNSASDSATRSIRSVLGFLFPVQAQNTLVKLPDGRNPRASGVGASFFPVPRGRGSGVNPASTGPLGDAVTSGNGAERVMGPRPWGSCGVP
jgi:hypothetical protein